MKKCSRIVIRARSWLLSHHLGQKSLSIRKMNVIYYLLLKANQKHLPYSPPSTLFYLPPEQCRNTVSNLLFSAFFFLKFLSSFSYISIFHLILFPLLFRCFHYMGYQFLQVCEIGMIAL